MSSAVSGLSLETGLINSTDTETLGNKLTQVSHETQSLQAPITTALFKIFFQEWITAKILPKWRELN